MKKVKKIFRWKKVKSDKRVLITTKIRGFFYFRDYPCIWCNVIKQETCCARYEHADTYKNTEYCNYMSSNVENLKAFEPYTRIKLIHKLYANI